MLPFAQAQIVSVYDNRGLLEFWQIGLLIALVIGPAEELFWRGFLQRELAARLGPWRGYLIAVAAYAGVHIVTRNAMLVVAAGTAGLLWAWLYMRTGRLWPGIVSHVVWDLTVFLIVPLA
ncbi:MAG: CPBP family intramembrane glutamic endopeptidase [bacterium]